MCYAFSISVTYDCNIVAQYFLAVDCIHLAILEYVAGNYFADAMILAKTRLPISDAIHMTVLEQWLEFLTTT